MIDLHPIMGIVNAVAALSFVMLGLTLLLPRPERILPIYVRKRSQIGFLMLFSAGARVGDVVGDHLLADGARLTTCVLGALTTIVAVSRLVGAYRARRF